MDEEVSFRIPEELYLRLRQRCLLNGKEIDQVLMDLIKAYLGKRPPRRRRRQKLALGAYPRVHPKLKLRSAWDVHEGEPRPPRRLESAWDVLDREKMKRFDKDQT